ncbi:hypothetical protein B5F24_13620 [Bacteroides clarus]|uniref:Uncharacterized protein n=1 Tax=Bacteroides clarus TaxID=626929 RepID=A0A1Y4JJE0_9BACE|nr:hypothetical protein [Bacteroides clarus]OUP32628.1 hypothetical protein B5F24_13620 [Bacteroides clarus]
MNPITIPNISIPTIGIPTIGIPSVGFPSASGGGLAWPAGLKESIKAIYDPAKQGMTNYDVIESYTEDFTTWRYLDSRGIATITGSTIHITEAKSIQGIVEDNKEPYSDIKILVQGVTADNPLNVRDINGTKAVIDKDGVYEFKDNGLYFGFGFSKVGVVDVTITQLPTSILKDFSGNGNHAYLYGGKGKLNSGMGVYKFDFLSDLLINSAYLPYTERQYDSICSLAGHPNGWLFQYKSLTDIPTFKIEVKGIVNDKFHYRWYDENGNRGVDFVIDKDGIYEFPMSYSVETNTGVGIVCNNICQDNVCFTQIPDYPNQLCYDGKMYAVCYDFPILTDYTVMADRTWFENEGNRVFITKGNIWPNCAFNFEKVNVSLNSETFSFSKSTNIDDLIGKSGITYQTKQSYNGKVIGVGTSSDGDILLIGGQLKGEYIGCHGKIIIADRSFTEEEINWLKDNWKKI